MFWSFAYPMFTACHSPRADLHAVRFDDYRGRILRNPGPWRTVCGLDVRGPLTAALFQQPDGSYLGDCVLNWPPPRERRCPDCDRLTRPASGRDPHPKGTGSWADLRDAEQTPHQTAPPTPAPEPSSGSRRVPGSLGGVKLDAAGPKRRSSSAGTKARTSSGSEPKNTRSRSRSGASKS